MQKLDKSLHNIIPAPQSYIEGDGWFEFDNETRIEVSHPELVRQATFFKALLTPVSGLNPRICSTDSINKHNVLRLKLDNTIASKFAYQIHIQQDAIIITAHEDIGIFWGIQTLRQLLPNDLEKKELAPNICWRVKAADIVDKPAYDYRGMHFDVGRHFFSIEHIKKYLDILAMYKINYFHWHLADDQGWRIQIQRYPKLTEQSSHRESTVIGHTLDRDSQTDGIEHRGFYTQAEIRDIIQYAERRFITVIPEIDIPGHCSALLAAYPEYACKGIENPSEVKSHFGIFKNVLCTRESSYDFLTYIFSEIASLFPSEYIHIGGDEVKKDHWQNCSDCTATIADNDLKDYQELQGYFINRVVKIISSLGKKVIAWDDILQSDNIDSNLTIMSWLGEASAHRAISNNNKLIMTQSNLYFDFYQSLSTDEPLAIHGHTSLKDVYNYDPIPSALEYGREHIVGAQANLWTEYIATTEQAEYMLAPRITALSEILWTPKKQQDWNGYKHRLRSHFQRFDNLKINASRSLYVPILEANHNSSGSLDLTAFAEDPDHEIRITLDGTRPSKKSHLYTKALTINKKTFIKAVCIEPVSGECFGISQLTIEPHLALGCAVTLDNQKYCAAVKNLNILTNGRLQQQLIFQHDLWACFINLSSFELTLDLQEERSVSSISIGFDGCIGRKLYLPTAIEILGSIDKKNRTSLSCCKESSHTTEKDNRAVLTLNDSEFRYLHIEIKNEQQIYSHEDQEHQTPTIYIDEIIVH